MTVVFAAAIFSAKLNTPLFTPRYFLAIVSTLPISLPMPYIVSKITRRSAAAPSKIILRMNALD